VRPPLPPWAPLAWFALLAAVLSAVVLVLAPPPGHLDDPDPAQQRDGLLRSGPVVAAELLGVRFGSRPVLLLFDRNAPSAEQLTSYVDGLPDGSAVRLVLPQEPERDLPVPVVVDAAGRLAEAVGMPEPVDGGFPVGYAVVDADRQVRYATLDPEYLDNVFGARTIVGAVR
jgi:hypothetical protein